MAGLFIRFLVEKCVTCESRKSDFGWHRFRFSPSSMRIMIENSQAILAFSNQVSLGNYCSFCLFFSLSNFMKSSVVYAVTLCTFVRFETLIWPSVRFDISSQNFKKPLVSSPQIERKRSEEYLVRILAVRKKLWAIFLPRVHLWKKQTPGSRLKT